MRDPILRFISVPCTAALVAIALSACEDSPTGPGSPTDADVRAASLAWDEAYNSGDIDDLIDLYLNEAVSIPPGLPALVGKVAILADFEAFYGAYDPTHQTTILEIEIEGDIAIERANYSFSATALDGSGSFSETGKHIVIRKWDGTSLRILWEIWNQDPL
jgi:ketosteroid isomerase-like protein